MLVVGGGLSAWRGYRQLVEREPLESPVLALAVLTLAIVTNGYAVSLSVRKLVTEDGSLREAFRDMKRPLVKSALLRDAVGTFTSVVGPWRSTRASAWWSSTPQARWSRRSSWRRAPSC